MQQLLGELQLGSSPDAKNVVRELFLQRLPDSVRMIRAYADAATADIGKLANMIINVARSPSISAIHCSNRSGYSEEVQTDIKEVRLEVSRLTELVPSYTLHQIQIRTQTKVVPPTPTTNAHI